MNHLTETQLNEHLDLMLDEASQQQVQAHLDICEQCHAELNELATLFAALDELPDVPLTRDLTSGVLARLPKLIKIPNLWKQPAFVMQSLLTAVLVGVSIPILQAFRERLPQFESSFTFPTFAFPTWTEIATEFLALFVWRFEFDFTLPTFAFEIPQIPTLPQLPVSFEPGIMIGLVAVATILWGFGNFSLLRSKPEVHG